LRDDARQDIGAAAGGKRHDHLYGVIGVIGGGSRQRQRANRESQRGDPNKHFEILPSLRAGPD
jgi:hypothetical protein